jgi:hypothetical protein
MVRRNWTYGLCETCMKNLHEEVKMERILISSTDDSDKSEQMWCCPLCGATKRL